MVIAGLDYVGFGKYESKEKELIGKKMHSFEASGLGAGPYKFLFWDDAGHDSYCQHCGHSIRYRFHFVNEVGKEFYVGSTCVGYSGDAGLVLIADGIKKQIQKAQAEARYQKVKDEFEGLLINNKERLETTKHPYGYANRTMFDYFVHCWRYSTKSNAKSFLVRLQKALENI